MEIVIKLFRKTVICMLMAYLILPTTAHAETSSTRTQILGGAAAAGALASLYCAKQAYNEFCIKNNTSPTIKGYFGFVKNIALSFTSKEACKKAFKEHPKLTSLLYVTELMPLWLLLLNKYLWSQEYEQYEKKLEQQRFKCKQLYDEPIRRFDIACKNGDFTTVKQLIKFKVIPWGKNKRTKLKTLLKDGHLYIPLGDHDEDQRPYEFESNFMLKYISFQSGMIPKKANDYCAIAQLLINNGANTEGKNKALIIACESGSSQMVKLLLKNGADVHATDRTEAAHGINRTLLDRLFTRHVIDYSVHGIYRLYENPNVYLPTQLKEKIRLLIAAGAQVPLNLRTNHFLLEARDEARANYGASMEGILRRQNNGNGSFNATTVQELPHHLKWLVTSFLGNMRPFENDVDPENIELNAAATPQVEELPDDEVNNSDSDSESENPHTNKTDNSHTDKEEEPTEE